VGRKESGGSEGPASESKIGKQAVTVPSAFRCWEVRGRRNGRSPCIQDEWLGGLGGGRGGEEASSITVPPFYLFYFVRIICKGNPYPENGAQRRLGAEDLLCMG
jgi:hypothetical protein